MLRVLLELFSWFCRCERSDVTVTSLYVNSELQLKNVRNDSNVKIIHLVADPRLVTVSLWLREKTGGEWMNERAGHRVSIKQVITGNTR